MIEHLKVEVLPNPIKDKLQITVEFNESDHLIELYTILGQQLKVLREYSLSIYSFDFPYAPGIYIVNLHTNRKAIY
jgi:hypothetical protein